MSESIKIKIRGTLIPRNLKASGFYLTTISDKGEIERIRQDAPGNIPAQAAVNDICLAGAMIWGAEQLIRRLEKYFPDMDVRGKAQEVYEELERQDEENEVQE